MESILAKSKQVASEQERIKKMSTDDLTRLYMNVEDKVEKLKLILEKNSKAGNPIDETELKNLISSAALIKNELDAREIEKQTKSMEIETK